MVGFVQVTHTAVVRDGEAGVSVFAAEDALNHAGVSVHGLAPDVVVADHHVEGFGLLKAHLERTQKHVQGGDFVHEAGSGVGTAFAGTVHAEVLEGGAYMVPVNLPVHHVALIGFHLGDSQAAVQVRVFAHGLLRAAPARVPGDVHHGRQDLVTAFGADFPGHQGVDLGEQVLVPGTGQADRHREMGGVFGLGAVQAFFVHHHGDAQARLFQEVALYLVVQLGSLTGREGMQVVLHRRLILAHTGPFAQAVLEGGVPLGLVNLAVFRVKGHPVVPDALELGHFLFQGHPGEQVGHPLFGGFGGVFVERFPGGSGGSQYQREPQ